MPSTLGVYASAAWTPHKLAPAVWFDASDTSTITQTSGLVSQWSDKSGNNRHATQAASAAQPTTGTATQNDRNVLVFDGTDALALAADLTTTAYTLFIIYSSTTGTAGQSLLSSLTSSPSWFLQRGGTPNPLHELTVGYDVNLGFNTASKRLVTSRKTGSTGTRTLRANGVNRAITSGSQGAGTLVMGYIGRRNDGGSTFLACEICEIIVIPSAITDSEILLTEAYLNGRWGLY